MHKNTRSPCEQRRAPSRRPSSGPHKGDQSTWAKSLGVSSCRTGTESWPGPAEGTPLSPPLPKGKEKHKMTIVIKYSLR